MLDHVLDHVIEHMIDNVLGHVLDNHFMNNAFSARAGGLKTVQWLLLMLWLLMLLMLLLMVVLVMLLLLLLFKVAFCCGLWIVGGWVGQALVGVARLHHARSAVVCNNQYSHTNLNHKDHQDAWETNLSFKLQC